MVDGQDDRSRYSPPGAGVGDSRAALSRRIGWKLYFWLLTASIAVMYPLLGLGWMQLLDWMDLAVTVVGLSGLFGFAHRRAIGTGAFWRRWFPFEVLWDVVIAFLVAPAGLAHQFPEQAASSTAEAMLNFVFILPLYIAVYRYGYRSPDIW